ncbi:tetratricopeptide repeat protein [Nocardiopsis sp. HNM0947]|uniref:Tetratricopeptide repeat protein n=1 Tax=Nocardiopsis coralli TaxID=2772213 RepID=A0ABR9P1H7_9ACTN|nr:tetratricopeptide repeat protein [Nocardiopsis coralli]MBE2997698.1 tetratricopeptide repeat protein [Nocardiopsis coralli]
MADVSGRAVQARDVQGGVHFHGHGPDPGRPPVPRQLPGDVHGFVNRLGETEVLSARLRGAGEDAGPEAPIHVITGTAGVGKTALALHWAHRVREHFADGQLYVDLRGYGPGPVLPPDQVLDRFLRALGVAADTVPADLDSRAALYRSLLADRRALVLLDNASSAAQVRPLLPGSSGCMVLITSRDRLSGLVARDGAQRLTVRTLAPAEAVELLEHVTVHDRPKDDPEEISELARLCAQLPLALRIAAERAASRSHMPLGELIQDLRDESGLWDALATDDEEEADAVHSVFAWSYRALPEETARLFRLLGLHPGHDFDAGAAAALAGVPVRRARRILDSLVGAHLVEQSGRDRYRFHDLLRSYALDQARREEDPEQHREALERLLTWYLRTADSAARALDSPLRHSGPGPESGEGAGQGVPGFAGHSEAVRWFETESKNLVTMAETAASAGMDHIAWRLPVVLRHDFVYRAPMSEWVTATLLGLGAARREQEQAAEADLSESLGMAYVQSHRWEEAKAHHQRALRLRQEAGDRFGEAMSLNALGLALLREHRLDEARDHFERSLAEVRLLGERRWEGIALGNLADALLDSGRPQEAVSPAEEAVAIHRETGNRMSEFACLVCVGAAWRELGRTDRALEWAQRALDVARELGNSVREGFALLELGRVHVDLGNSEEALACFHEAAVLHRRIGDHAREAEAFEGAGVAYDALRLPGEAAKFYLQAVHGYRKKGLRWKLAVCLDRLASVSAATGNHEAARESRQAALEALEGFTDPQAVRLRGEIRVRAGDRDT